MRHAYPSLGPNLFSMISKTDLGNLFNQISSKGNYISCEILIQNTANTPLDILVWRLSNYIKLNANMSFNHVILNIHVIFEIIELVSLGVSLFATHYRRVSRYLGPISSIKFVRHILNCAYVVF